MIMDNYATVDDVILLWRQLSNDEVTKVEALIPLLCDNLRYRAEMAGRDLDQMIAMTPALASVAKEVIVSAISRILREPTSGAPMQQESQSGLGYSWSGTYAIPAGGIGNAILPSDLKRLGLKRGRYGTIDPYAPGDAGYPFK